LDMLLSSILGDNDLTPTMYGHKTKISKHF